MFQVVFLGPKNKFMEICFFFMRRVCQFTFGGKFA